MNQAQTLAYRLTADLKLNAEQISDILDLTQLRGVTPREVLGGRGYVVRASIEGLGPVVMKQYHRGGLIGRLNPSYYLKIGEYRPKIEYDLLNSVIKLGVRAPQPLAWLVRGGFFYQGWLLLEEIQHEFSLAQLAVQAPERLPEAMHDLCAQLGLLIKAGVYHIDFHPGNVLVDAANKTHIIDFDKAHYFSGNARTLRDRYICRWRRAVIKHALPDMLSEYFCADIRRLAYE